MTQHIGRTVIHAPVVGSSFDLIEGGSTLHHGLVVVVDQQAGGRGRSGNKWLSPPGCAMFSLQLEINLKACAKLPLVQHLVGLAAVHAINTHRPEAELKLKWPNDIYTSQGIKLGGVVVYSSIFRDKVQLDIG